MSKITQSARGMDCQVRIIGICKHNSETVIWAHCNAQAAGKGVGLKSIDELGAYCCADCHDVYDRRRKAPKGMTREQVELDFAHGHYRSIVILKIKGLLSNG